MVCRRFPITVNDTSFPRNVFRGNVLCGKRFSGKCLQESDYPGNVCKPMLMNIDEMQMSTLSEELSLMLSCLRESQLQAAQCRAGVTAADSATTDSRRHVDMVRRRYDVCFTRAEWRMTEQDGQIGLADLLLANFLYTKLNHDDDSGYHQLELGAFKVRRSFPPLLVFS